MLALERQNKIMDILISEGVVSVKGLSRDLAVTEETIRRDLEKLEKKESLRRTHGGAVPIDDTSYDLSLEKRKSTNVEEKARLAKIAAGHIVSGDTVFLDASTTTFFMAREIKRLSNVTVITNSMRVIAELDGAENIKVIAIGGILSRNQSFVGSMAEKAIEENYFAGKMFFSAKGITTAGILDSNELECGIKKKMMQNSNTKYCICDSSKIGHVGFVKLSDFDDIDCFITSELNDRKIKNKLEENEVEIITDNE